MTQAIGQGMYERENGSGRPERPIDAARQAGDDRVRPGKDRFRLPPWKPLVFITGVLLSPVAGLVFGMDFALGVLVLAMAFTSWMAWEGANHVAPEDAPRLRRAAMLNGVLAVAGVVLIVLRQLA